MTLEPDHVFRIAVIAIVFGGPTICAVSFAVCHSWVRVTNHKYDVELKHRLLDAGMTAEEITSVMNSGAEHGSSTELCRKNERTPEMV